MTKPKKKSGKRKAAGRKGASSKRKPNKSRGSDDLLGLSEREFRFVMFYVKHFNASHAARAAGYSASSAGKNADRILKRPRVAEAIERVLETAKARARAEAEEAAFERELNIEEEKMILARIARAHPRAPVRIKAIEAHAKLAGHSKDRVEHSLADDEFEVDLGPMIETWRKYNPN